MSTVQHSRPIDMSTLLLWPLGDNGELPLCIDAKMGVDSPRARRLQVFMAEAAEAGALTQTRRAEILVAWARIVQRWLPPAHLRRDLEARDLLARAIELAHLVALQKESPGHAREIEALSETIADRDDVDGRADVLAASVLSWAFVDLGSAHCVQACYCVVDQHAWCDTASMLLALSMLVKPDVLDNVIEECAAIAYAALLRPPQASTSSNALTGCPSTSLRPAHA